MGFASFALTLVAASALLGILFYALHVSVWNRRAAKGGQGVANKQPRKVLELVLAAVALTALLTLLLSNSAQFAPVLKTFWEGLPGNLYQWDLLVFVMLSSIMIAANLEVLRTPPQEERATSDTKTREATRPVRTLADISHSQDNAFTTRTYYTNYYNYAATALKDTSSSYITAVSILIPASFVIIQVYKSPTQGGTMTAEAVAAAAAAVSLVFRGVVWFLFSLLCGAVTLYRVFTHGRYEDLSRAPIVAVFLIFQFNCLLTGVLALAAGLYHAVFN